MGLEHSEGRKRGSKHKASPRSSNLPATVAEDVWYDAPGWMLAPKPKHKGDMCGPALLYRRQAEISLTQDYGLKGLAPRPQAAATEHRTLHIVHHCAKPQFELCLVQGAEERSRNSGYALHLQAPYESHMCDL